MHETFNGHTVSFHDQDQEPELGVIWDGEAQAEGASSHTFNLLTPQLSPPKSYSV